MNYTRLFSIEWDDSYNEPDFSIPGTFEDWLVKNEDKREKLAKHLEWLAQQLRNNENPFRKSDEVTSDANL